MCFIYSSVSSSLSLTSAKISFRVVGFGGCAPWASNNCVTGRNSVGEVCPTNEMRRLWKALPAEFPSAMQLLKAQSPARSQPIPGTISSASYFTEMNRFSKYFPGLSQPCCTSIPLYQGTDSALFCYQHPSYSLPSGQGPFCAVILPFVGTQIFVRYQLLQQNLNNCKCNSWHVMIVSKILAYLCLSVTGDKPIRTLCDVCVRTCNTFDWEDQFGSYGNTVS